MFTKQRAGFRVHGEQNVVWRLFSRLSVETTELPLNTLFPFEHAEKA